MQGVYLAEHGLAFVKTCFQLYSGQILFVSAFFVLIIMLLSQKYQTAQFFSLYTLFLILTIFNPIAVKLVFGSLGMDNVYYRFFWLLPINIVIAYGIVWLISTQKKRLFSFGMAILCMGMIVFLGQPVVKKEMILDVPDNLYMVSDEVLEVSEHLHQYSEDETPKAAVSDELLMVIRQYDASIELSVQRDYLLAWRGMPDFQWIKRRSDYSEQEIIMKTIYAGDITEPDKFLTALNNTETQFVVVAKSVGIHEFLISLDMEYTAETESYIIYKVVPV